MFFIILFTILSAAGSACIYIFTGLYQNLAFLVWFPLVVFIGIWLVLFLLLCLFIVISSQFFSKKKPQKKPSLFAQWILSEAGDITKAIAGIHVSISVEDKKLLKEIKKSKKQHIFVANHTSNFDQFLLWSLFKFYPIIALSKPEIMNMPIIGNYSYKACNISIDRDNPMKALRGISNSVKLLNDNPNTSLSMFPEGTRSKSGEMLPFHATTFIIAEKTKLPIVLMTIQNANAVKHRFPFRRTVVYLDVVKVITSEEIEKMSTQEMSDISHELISKHLEENQDRLYKTK